MTPSQNYKSSHRGFSLAELTAAAVIMVGIWLGALAYMNAASEEFEEAKEETLDQTPEEDIAILTEIRAAERALVASEAVTEEAREAWEEAEREQAYRDFLHEAIDIIDSGDSGRNVSRRLRQHRDILHASAYTYHSYYDALPHYHQRKKWPTERSEMKQLCKNLLKIRGKGWSCDIVWPSNGHQRWYNYNPSSRDWWIVRIDPG